MSFITFLRSLCIHCCLKTEDPLPDLPDFYEPLQDAELPRVSSVEPIRVELPRSSVPIIYKYTVIHEGNTHNSASTV